MEIPSCEVDLRLFQVDKAEKFDFDPKPPSIACHMKRFPHVQASLKVANLTTLKGAQIHFT